MLRIFGYITYYLIFIVITITFSYIISYIPSTEITAPEGLSASMQSGARYYFGQLYRLSISSKQLRNMEIVKYSIRKNEMTASVMCIGAERRGAPYADAQYWGRYGRCIVKGYPRLTTIGIGQSYGWLMELH